MKLSDRDTIIELTPLWKGERFPDGRPKVPKKYLDEMGIKYTVDGTIVRGLDYYTKTVFEIVSKNIGAQGTVCGGGRYNGLVESLGGPEMPGVGFGLGMERLMLLIENLGIEIECRPKLRPFRHGTEPFRRHPDPDRTPRSERVSTAGSRHERLCGLLSSRRTGWRSTLPRRNSVGDPARYFGR